MKLCEVWKQKQEEIKYRDRYNLPEEQLGSSLFSLRQFEGKPKHQVLQSDCGASLLPLFLLNWKLDQQLCSSATPLTHLLSCFGRLISHLQVRLGIFHFVPTARKKKIIAVAVQSVQQPVTFSYLPDRRPVCSAATEDYFHLKQLCLILPLYVLNYIRSHFMGGFMFYVPPFVLCKYFILNLFHRVPSWST